MGYEEFIKTQNKINKTQVIWSQVNDYPDKFKTSVERKARIIFYEDLYNQLPSDVKQEIESPEELKETLKMYFKCENISYNFIKSYKDFVIKKFENGYLWNKITSEKKYNELFKEVEIIDKDIEHKSIGINYPKMFEAVKDAYPKYITTKKEMKTILNTYFEKNNMNVEYIKDEDEYLNYTENVVKRVLNK
ncbi:MAG: hypothetical protein E7311_02375 [Clostridiales bacterium]|nr:hypothetical protein [Clostridiales bacterium]